MLQYYKKTNLFHRKIKFLHHLHYHFKNYNYKIKKCQRNIKLNLHH